MLNDIQQIPAAEFCNLGFKSAKSVSTDSRMTSANEIFFALRGEKFDGHDFVADVIKRKAACAVVDRKWFHEKGKAATKLPLVVVEDTTRALGDLANIYRRRFSLPVIAIGGSNGKTTTKEMTAKVLGKRLKVVKTSGNHNNQIGVPLTIFSFSKNYEAAVVEIGTNHSGEIRRLCEVLQPDAGLITNIGAEHLEFFKDIDGVRKEELQLFASLVKSRGIAFVNTDDTNIPGAAGTPQRKFTYGFISHDRLTRSLSGRLFGLDKKGCALFEMKWDGKTEVVHLGVLGIHNAMNALAAAAVGLHYGINLLDVKKALESFKAIDKRMQYVEVSGIRILNDTYNSNPESAVAAIQWLSSVRAGGKKFAVFGDMLELGASAKREHRRLGAEIAQEGIDYLFTFGNLSKEIASSAENRLRLGPIVSRRLEIQSFESKQELSERLLRSVSPGDVVLVKGSRGMKMEDVVDDLTGKLGIGGAD